MVAIGGSLQCRLYLVQNAGSGAVATSLRLQCGLADANLHLRLDWKGWGEKMRKVGNSRGREHDARSGKKMKGTQNDRRLSGRTCAKHFCKLRVIRPHTSKGGKLVQQALGQPGRGSYIWPAMHEPQPDNLRAGDNVVRSCSRSQTWSKVGARPKGNKSSHSRERPTSRCAAALSGSCRSLASKVVTRVLAEAAMRYVKRTSSRMRESGASKWRNTSCRTAHVTDLRTIRSISRGNKDERSEW